MGTIRELEDDLGEAVRDIPREVRKITSKAMLNIKVDAKALLRGYSKHRFGGHAKYLAPSINYDVKQRGAVIEGEVGPDLDKVVAGGRQGPLGGFLEYGTLNNAPTPYLGPPYEAEIPRYQEHLGRVAESLLDGRAQ